MSLPNIFDTCRLRADVLAGTIRDDGFMAEPSRVLNGTSPINYLNPAVFFAKSCPTRGIKEQLKATRLRFSGEGGVHCSAQIAAAKIPQEVRLALCPGEGKEEVE